MTRRGHEKTVLTLQQMPFGMPNRALATLVRLAWAGYSAMDIPWVVTFFHENFMCRSGPATVPDLSCLT